MTGDLFSNDGCDVFLEERGNSLHFTFDNYDKNNGYHMLRYALEATLKKFGGKTKQTSYIKHSEEEPTIQKEDIVHHPSHYTSHPSGVECIEVTKHMNFPLGSAMKYLWRVGLKDDALIDLRKAKEYIDIEIGRLEGLDKERNE